MTQKHGRNTYYIAGEGFVGADQPAANEQSEAAATRSVAANAQPDPQRAFHFSRMFPDLPKFRPDPSGLIALGLAMEDSPVLYDHPQLPAGYTYFGQFLDHDITRDKTAGLPTGELTVEEIEQGRSPALDLDSVYGRGPVLEAKHLYENDKVRLRIGSTTGAGDSGRPETRRLPNDLPRGDNPAKPLAATIGDPRNDENLAVAQTHLSFLKLHNVVSAQLAASGYQGCALFDRARKLVTLHYQWIVLHDFLPRIIDPEVLNHVIVSGRQFFEVKDGEAPTMPIEFSVAAYRLGHSMIRDVYNWNRITTQAGLFDLFTFAGLTGDMGGLPTLPSTWPIDWRRFYDFGHALGHAPRPPMNRTRSIDTGLALNLQNLPGFKDMGHMASLAVRNLLRGRLLGLPTGQDVANAMRVGGLTPAQVCQGSHEKIIKDYGFDTHTPLWYYVLKEAEVLTGGERLGPVGSRLLAETFVGLIEGSRHSILTPENRYWRPMLPSQRPGHFTMADMLLLVNDLNPLGADKETIVPPIIHLVQRGETLYTIAARYFGDDRFWTIIFQANRDKIANPNLIHVGMELVIPSSNALDHAPANAAVDDTPGVAAPAAMYYWNPRAQ